MAEARRSEARWQKGEPQGLLDGAKVVGFEVGREERALEGLLRRLEERGVRV